MKNGILITKYILNRPYEFIKKEEYIDDIPQGHALVRVLEASICTADLRYFCGRRSKPVLDSKLPMALLHEGIGEVVGINGEGLKVGDKVVFIPNIPCKLDDSLCRTCPHILSTENYCPNAKFISSNCDGLSCNHILYPINCMEQIPKDIDTRAAIFSELLSVGYEACAKLSKTGTDLKRRCIILGSGVLAYLLTLVLYYIFGVEKERLIIVGRESEKIKKLNDISTLTFTDDFNDESIEADVIFECTGGKRLEETINYAINIVKPGGSVMLLGVSENKIPINTRLILEKNIRLMGISRSPKAHYKIIVEVLKNQVFSDRVKEIINKEFIIKSTEDLYNAFECFKLEKERGKIICYFKDIPKTK